ncbi:hypothetical protein GGR55DRAFT_277273 [Xylaria sp. FL0064]|nr:hypothetical protein GGR55DRAFT_277273 [Xylaria sp. FL0064]
MKLFTTSMPGRALGHRPNVAAIVSAVTAFKAIRVVVSMLRENKLTQVHRHLLGSPLCCPVVHPLLPRVSETAIRAYLKGINNRTRCVRTVYRQRQQPRQSLQRSSCKSMGKGKLQIRAAGRPRWAISPPPLKNPSPFSLGRSNPKFRFGKVPRIPTSTWISPQICPRPFARKVVVNMVWCNEERAHLLTRQGSRGIGVAIFRVVACKETVVE